MMASCQLLLLGGEFSSPQMHRSGHHTYQSFITQGSYLQATWCPWILLSDILLASGCLCCQEAYLVCLQYVPLMVCLCSIGVYNKLIIYECFYSYAKVYSKVATDCIYVCMFFFYLMDSTMWTILILCLLSSMQKLDQKM